MEISDRNKEYFWQSRKDGCFYTLKLNSVNQQGNYHMFIQDCIHYGYLSPAPRERIGNIKTFHKETVELDTDFERTHLNYLLEIVKTKGYLEFQREIEVYFDLYDLLIKHPDIYLKNVDKLFKNKTFKRIMEGEIKRPLT